MQQTTVIRIKRKFREECHDVLLVEERASKRSNYGGGLLDAFKTLSTEKVESTHEITPSSEELPKSDIVSKENEISSFIFERIDSISAKKLAEVDGLVTCLSSSLAMYLPFICIISQIIQTKK
jgi:hypothetical protein